MLFHLIGDYYRRRKRDPHPLPIEHDPAAAAEKLTFSDSQFLESWRSELLSCAWKALAEHEDRTGQPFHSVLRLRAEKVDLRSTELAAQLSATLHKDVSSDWVRQNLHRAREKFAELLVDEVMQTMVQPGLHDLEDELIVLDLYQYCRPALGQIAGTQS